MSCLACGGRGVYRAFSKNGYDICRCHDCGLMFVHPIPKTDDVYTADYFSGARHGFGYVHYDDDKEPMVPVFKKYLALVERTLGGKGSLLDVGAATGFFVRLANEAGFVARGIEISDHAAAIGRAKGLDIQTGTLADVVGRFDVITMLDVIEHVPDPRGEIRRAAQLLRPGGVLVINTPDAGSRFARIMHTKWHLIVPPEHLYYFNRANIAKILDDEGFAIVQNTTIGKSFTFSYIMKTLHKWTKLWIFERLASAFSIGILSRLALPINLHDNMFILARRR